MLPLTTHCQTHYHQTHYHLYYLTLFKFKDLVAKQHPALSTVSMYTYMTSLMCKVLYLRPYKCGFGWTNRTSCHFTCTRQILEAKTTWHLQTVWKKFWSVSCYPITRAVLKASRILKTLYGFSKLWNHCKCAFSASQYNVKSNYEIAQKFRM